WRNDHSILVVTRNDVARRTNSPADGESGGVVVHTKYDISQVLGPRRIGTDEVPLDDPKVKTDERHTTPLVAGDQITGAGAWNKCRPPNRDTDSSSRHAIAIRHGSRSCCVCTNEVALNLAVVRWL